MSKQMQVRWEHAEVVSPWLEHPVSVVAARDLPYLPGANRFQNLSLYLPSTARTTELVGSPVDALPGASSASPLPSYLVHVHGGAWRDPELGSASIEPAVAHAFSATVEPSAPLLAVASINYSLSQFPTHPTLPYDAVSNHHTDPAREAVHPQHVSDVLHGLALLRLLGLRDEAYVLSGHSAGACLAAQAVLMPASRHGLDLVEPPRPAALLGMNGLYDLPGLLARLDPTHEHLREEYESLLSFAFGADQSGWPAASPALVDPAQISPRVHPDSAPRLVVLDGSEQDQLVPMNQRDRLHSVLSRVSGMRVVKGRRCTGEHAAPWQQGWMIWENVQDVIALLGQS